MDAQNFKLASTGALTCKSSITQLISRTNKFSVITSGSTDVGGTVSATDNTTLSGTLTVSGTTTLNNTLTENSIHRFCGWDNVLRMFTKLFDEY